MELITFPLVPLSRSTSLPPLLFTRLLRHSRPLLSQSLGHARAAAKGSCHKLHSLVGKLTIVLISFWTFFSFFLFLLCSGFRLLLFIISVPGLPNISFLLPVFCSEEVSCLHFSLLLRPLPFLFPGSFPRTCQIWGVCSSSCTLEYPNAVLLLLSGISGLSCP